jgi:hypothetical protein
LMKSGARSVEISAMVPLIWREGWPSPTLSARL